MLHSNIHEAQGQGQSPPRSGKQTHGQSCPDTAKGNHVWLPYWKPAVQDGGHERRVSIRAGILNPPSQPCWPFGVQAWAWLACDLSWGLQPLLPLLHPSSTCRFF